MPVNFVTEPAAYRHWRLELDGPIATVVMGVAPDGGLRDDYELKLNSYDLAVDIELYDAVQRLRFEHPEVHAVVLTGGLDKVFCAGANIQMLAGSTHGHKVNFCKFTNETRNGIEDATAHSGQVWIAAVNGTAAGGGYELALACDEILLVDDRASAVSLPELPLLAVLPGTGGLTRVVDKRHVRRDLADVFATRAEGAKGRQALEWGLVDAVAPRSSFDELVRTRAEARAATSDRPADGAGVALTPLRRTIEGDVLRYDHVAVDIDRSLGAARIMVHGPSGRQPATAEELVAAGAGAWILAAVRELDDAILHLRFNEGEVGTWILLTSGDPDAVAAAEAVLAEAHWLARETRLYWARTLKRLDVSARTLVALIEPGSCCTGTLAELALAADRTYMLDGAWEGSDAPPPVLKISAANDGWYPMSNGLTRLATRFWGRDDALERAREQAGKDLRAAEALDAGLITFAFDDLDWEDEVRLLLEERNSFSPDALTGLEANNRFVGPETMETKIFARLSAWQNWIFQRPNAVGPDGALHRFGTGTRPTFDREGVTEMTTTNVDIDARIPNNVDLAGDRRLQRALESWQPKFIEWWKQLGPVAFQDNPVYLRTAVDVGQEGWANFGHVAMPDYRWGIFLAEPEPDRRIAFGEHLGEPVWHDVPGEHRADLRRLLVVQGDTEPASVEQQRHLCTTAPSLYDLRNLFQVNVEEGRHLWAMVYLLHRYFGRDGRDEADEMLERHSGDADKPRILGAFNEPTPDWLSFFMFTYFTDRDGKFQLASLRESAFDPLSRTCDFMLKEEAYHMFVGASGVGRVVERTVTLMQEHDTDDVRPHGGIDVATLQRYLNFHCSLSLDLFGAETSTNAANYFAAGLKGRFHEEQRDDDHRLVGATRTVPVATDGGIGEREAPALSALNETLREDYIADCRKGIERWNRTLAAVGQRLELPHVGFNRAVGTFAGRRVSPEGQLLSDEEWASSVSSWLPTDDDRAFVTSLMVGVTEPGRMAGWVAPPSTGVHAKPVDFDYVRI